MRGECLYDQKLSKYTSWRVGGTAARIFKPADVDDLADFLKTTSPAEPIIWLGLGSNTLIRDCGFAGTVIITLGALDTIEKVSDNMHYAQAGVPCAGFARYLARNNLVGGEFLAGIPGTMGGALCMNAGCFNGETWQHVVYVDTIDRQGEIHRREISEYQVAYRSVVGPKDEWFTGALFEFTPGEKATALATIKQLLARRAATQPTSDYNSGSVFRNPTGDYAARLIESCGLKGFRLGTAHVSEKHANFIISEKEGRASDIEALIEHVHATVLKETGIDLIREVVILGDAI